jgi:hypothetical protein
LEAVSEIGAVFFFSDHEEEKKIKHVPREGERVLWWNDQTYVVTRICWDIDVDVVHVTLESEENHKRGKEDPLA